MTIQQLESKITGRRADSPLFAYLANEYLVAGRIGEARELCQSGLSHYPSYSTAHLVLAKCHVAEGNFQRAISSIQDLQSLGADSPLIENFYQQCLMHLVATPQPSLPAELAHAFWTPSPDEEAASAGTGGAPKEEPMLPPADLSAQPPDAGAKKAGGAEKAIAVAAEPASPAPSLEGGGEQHHGLSAEELSQIQPAGIEEGKRIVSKTLAEIYAEQQEFGEAILTYRLLSRERPEMAGECDERIRELEGFLERKIAEEAAAERQRQA